jgi:N-acetylmuramoyl-L-alanine amidase
MRQTLRRNAAKIRPNVRGVFALLLVLSFFPQISRAEANSTSRRESAKAQFDRAEKQREALESRAEGSRTLKDYTSLVSTYKRVYLITPHGPEVPAALNQVAELYRTMGDLFSEKYYQSAVTSYQFLLREYPTSHFREAALLAIAHIEQDDMHDPVLARNSYEQFLALHPRSSHAEEVRATLGKLKESSATATTSPRGSAGKVRPESPFSPKTASVEKNPPDIDTRPEAKQAGKQESSTEISAARSMGAQVSRIRTWNADTYTRIVIDVGAQVKYQAARIFGPDRIYFDIEGAKIDSALLHKPIEVENGGFLKDVRIAQNQSGVVRVVLEVNHAKDYSVFLLPDPYRLVVDVYGSSAAAERAALSVAPPPGPTTDIPWEKTEAPVKEAAPKAITKTPGKSPEKSVSKPAAAPPEIAVATPKETNVAGSGVPAPASDSKPTSNKVVKKSDIAIAKPNANVNAEIASAKSDAAAAGSRTLSGETSTPATIESAMPGSNPVQIKKSNRSKKSAHEQAEEMGPPPTPELTRDGQHSLTRALGLKIGRIVIDAGHGGRDTGTIGPTGLMEKDLCLDVSLRVGKLIQQRLPGADVVYTRDDDTFIPLEHRTEIANNARADLFLSVHANSSQDRQARGIETYYLNFTGSSNAMEVASRENALSDNSVYDLQDIVNKIARNEKIEESRDFAGIVQDSLSKRMEGINHGDRNRGVRKAPFVVLIGANMPSVLAEISFISNPSDEQWLKKPENRQRVAEGLYHGIENYLHSTNSLANNQPHIPPGSHSGIVARSGNSQ